MKQALYRLSYILQLYHPVNFFQIRKHQTHLLHNLRFDISFQSESLLRHKYIQVAYHSIFRQQFDYRLEYIRNHGVGSLEFRGWEFFVDHWGVLFG